MYFRIIARKKTGIEIPISEPMRRRVVEDSAVAASPRRTRAGCRTTIAKNIAASASSIGRREALLISYGDRPLRGDADAEVAVRDVVLR